jgi:hypothetical protein
MARLPTPGGDNDSWGSVLNEYLEIAHNADGTLKLDVKTIADLKATDVTALTDKQQALVAGYYAPGDGGGGQFYYDAAASEADNGGTILAPTVGAGRWKRVYSGAVNVRWFGAKGDGVNNETIAFENANAAVDNILVPTGTFLVDSIAINRNVQITGTGRKTSRVLVQSYTTYQNIKCGILCRGAATSPSLTDLAFMSGLDIQITSGEAGQVGVLITRKLNMSDVYIHGAPGDGVYFRSVSSGTEAPYFCKFDGVWMKSNGGNGATITENCNGTLFINCQFSSNGGHGLHQTISGNGQPAAIYNTIVVGGQVAYNGFHGLYFASGSNNEVYGTYAEQNSDVDGGNPKIGAYKNVQLGPNVTRSCMVLGEQGTDISPELAIGLNTVIGNFVSIGGRVLTPYNDVDMGYENTSDGKNIVFRGAANCVHQIIFRETTADRLRFKYDGVANNLTLDSWTTGNTWVNVLTVSRDGTIAFFGATPQAKQTVTGSRGGNAALASMLTALANLGLITDNTTV